MQQYKIPVQVNPFGTIFNPVSMAHLLGLVQQQGSLDSKHCVQLHNQWYHYDLHSRFTASTPDQLLAQAQKFILQTAAFLSRARCLILTLGTAWVYQLKEDSHIVANCHKVPAQAFEKKLLSPEAILQPLQDVFSALTKTYPDLRIILTVSPVRHTKDSLSLNSLSKSLLRVACHYLAEAYPAVHYFPAYEIMLDDLRDYRFYKADMIHPSEVAEDYIWQFFTQTYMDADTCRFFSEWHKIRQALAHKPFQPGTEAYQRFLQETECKLLTYQTQVDISDELTCLQQLKMAGLDNQ